MFTNICNTVKTGRNHHCTPKTRQRTEGNRKAGKPEDRLWERRGFFFDGSYTFEIGGGNKNFEQIEGIPDSYLAIDDIETGIGKKIPLPENVKKVEKLMRATGFGHQVDQFELSMNRAAERAAPEAKSIFWDAVKQNYFRRSATIVMSSN